MANHQKGQLKHHALTTTSRTQKQFKISPYIEKQIANLSKGAIMAGINVGKLKNIFIFIPPLPLQNQFAALVEKVETLKTQYQQSLTELENLYAALSQKAFKGELDLSQSTYLNQQVQAQMAAQAISQFISNNEDLTADLKTGAEQLSSVEIIGSAAEEMKQLLEKAIHGSTVKDSHQLSSFIHFIFNKNFDFDDLSHALNDFDANLLNDVVSYNQIKESLIELLEQEPAKLQQRFDIARKQIMLKP